MTQNLINQPRKETVTFCCFLMNFLLKLKKEKLLNLQIGIFI